jgi:hypothetical protein
MSAEKVPTAQPGHFLVVLTIADTTQKPIALRAVGGEPDRGWRATLAIPLSRFEVDNWHARFPHPSRAQYTDILQAFPRLPFGGGMFLTP